MSPRLLFWVPVGLRLLGAMLICAVIGYFFGALVGLGAALVTVIVAIIMQLNYLYLLSGWLDNPGNASLPDGWGAWTDIFSRLYRLRRHDEKNRTELIEWLARFRQAMSLLPDGVVIMDDVLFMEWCNPAAERHLGLKDGRDTGMRVTNVIRNPDFMDYIILGRYDQPLTLSFRERKLIVQIIPFENRRQILVTHDATETERIEMMRRDFIANASHELRTPLTVINGFLEIASNQPDLAPETRAAHLKMMSEQGQRMQNLVDDMLVLTRLESIDYPLRMEPIDMPKLLDQILREGRALSAGRHMIDLVNEAPNIKGSSDELISAFGNLVSNAVRYTPDQGTITLLWQMGRGGPQFLVRDTGIGIRAEHINRLTERFYRVDKSRSRETQGTGLGLAIVKHVLLRHNAVLAIDSQPDEGSTFIVRFPPSALIAPLTSQEAT